MVRCRYACALGDTFFFLRFIERLVKFYPEIFEGGGGDTSQHQINFAKKWKSYSSIIELAGGDITKFDAVLEEPLEKTLLYLCWKSDRVMVDDLMHREMMKKSTI